MYTDTMSSDDFIRRVREIVDMPIGDLRRVASESDIEPSAAEARDEFAGWSRGQLVVKILVDQGYVDLSYSLVPEPAL